VGANLKKGQKCTGVTNEWDGWGWKESGRNSERLRLYRRGGGILPKVGEKTNMGRRQRCKGAGHSDIGVAHHPKGDPTRTEWADNPVRFGGATRLLGTRTKQGRACSARPSDVIGRGKSLDGNIFPQKGRRLERRAARGPSMRQSTHVNASPAK